MNDPSASCGESPPTVDHSFVLPTDPPGAMPPGDPTGPFALITPLGYEILHELGEGGMGVVYRARHAALDRPVALKLLRPHFAGTASAVARFISEARITARLQHPGIPPVHEVGTLRDGQPFLAMKLIQGRTLESLLREKGPDPARWLAVFESVCQAVAYAHSEGVIHRDLKPGNVMVGAFGEVQVMDWGLAKVLTSGPPATESDAAYPPQTEARGIDPTLPGSVLGTPAYMPPEQAAGALDRVNCRSDVFGLGGVLCALLTGKPPYAAAERAAVPRMAAESALGDAYARLDRSGAAPAMVRLAKRCLQADSELRPDAKEVAEEVGRYLGSLQQAKLRAERRAKRATAALALVVVAAVATGAGVVVSRQRQVRAEELAQQTKENDAAVSRALEQSRQRRESMAQAEVPALERLADESVAFAEEAAGAARRGPTSSDLVEAAERALTEAELRRQELAKDRHLLKRLHNAVLLPAGFSKRPSLHAQTREAFKEWGADPDEGPESSAVARIRERPTAIRQEILAALDLGALAGRQERAGVAWQRWFALSDAADGDLERAQLRKLLASSPLVEKDPTQSSANPLVPPIVEAAQVTREREWIKRKAGEADARHAPALNLVLLTRVLVAAGQADLAAGLLRQAVRHRPQELLLLEALGTQLSQQALAGVNDRDDTEKQVEAFQRSSMKSGFSLLAGKLTDEQVKKLREAIGYLRAVRTQRPEFGAVLGFALLFVGDVDEGEELIRHHAGLFGNDEMLTVIKVFRGMALYLKGEFASGEAYLQKELANTKGPSAAMLYEFLGGMQAGMGKKKEAEATLLKALDKYPENTSLCSTYADLLVESGRSKEALAYYRKAQPKANSRQPHESQVMQPHFRLAIRLLNLKKDAEAIVILKEGVGEAPDNPFLSEMLPTRLLADRRFAEAERAYRSHLKRHPPTKRVYRRLAETLQGQGKQKERIEVLKQAVALDAKDVELVADLAAAFIPVGNYVEAEKYARQAVKLAEGREVIESACQLILGYSLQSQNKFEPAAAAYRRSLSLIPVPGANPYAPMLNFELSNCLAKLGRYAEAEVALRKAMELAPQQARQNKGTLADLLFKQQKWDDLATLCRELIRENIQPEQAYHLLATMHERKREWAKAEAVLNDCITAGVAQARTYDSLGDVLWKQSRRAEAETAYRQAMRKSPAIYASESLASEFAIITRDYQFAEQRSRKAVLHAPNDPAAWCLRGRAFAGLNDPRRAEGAFRVALRLAPDHAEANLLLGTVFESRGEFRFALPRLKRGHELGVKSMGWSHPSAEMVRACERRLLLATKLPGVVAGMLWPDNREDTEGFADLCFRFHGRYALAARLYAEAHQGAASVSAEQRMAAACSAVLAAAGAGKDADALTSVQRLALRRWALTWLRASLRAAERDVGSGDSFRKLEAWAQVALWKNSPQLASVRDPQGLARLSVEEREAWWRFWADADRLIGARAR